MILTSEFFSFNLWEWFLHSSVLEQTEFDLTKINWLRGVILLILIVLVPWGRFLLCHTPMRPILAFRDQISILIVGGVTTWSWASHQLISELGSETRLMLMLFSFFFSVPLSFSVFALFIFLFFVSASSSQKNNNKVIFHFGTVSNHISSIYRKTKNRERERQLRWNLKGDLILLQKYNS